MSSSVFVNKTTKISVYRNGDRNCFGKPVVFNRRQMRDMENLLDTISDRVGFGEAVRSLHTPMGGTRLERIDELENAKEYVAVSKGQFKKLPYLDLEMQHNAWLKACKRSREQSQKQRTHYEVHGKLDKDKREVLVLYVYCNGNEFEPARRVLLTSRMQARWKYILAEINQRIDPHFGPVERLYTLGGRPVFQVNELESGGTYVAAGRLGGFKNVNYGVFKPAFTVSSHVQPIVPEKKTPLTAVDEADEAHNSSSSNDRLNYSHQSEFAQMNPSPRPKPNRLPKVIYPDGRSVFHRRPVKLKRRRAKPVDYDRDEGGIFKAQHQRVETRDAQEINETARTEVDLPVDLTEAAQVEEEVHKEEHFVASENENPTEISQPISSENRIADDDERMQTDASPGVRRQSDGNVRPDELQDNQPNDDQPTGEVVDQLPASGLDPEGQSTEQESPQDAAVPPDNQASGEPQLTERSAVDSTLPDELSGQPEVHNEPNVAAESADNHSIVYSTEETDEEAAAVKIQSIYRGHRVRKQFKG